MARVGSGWLGGAPSSFMLNPTQCLAVARGPKVHGSCQRDVWKGAEGGTVSTPASGQGAEMHPGVRARLAAVQPVEGCDLVRLRQGRIVEDGLAQELARAAVVDQDLADVDALRRALPAFAAAIAAFWPAGPLPMTTRS